MCRHHISRLTDEWIYMPYVNSFQKLLTCNTTLESGPAGKARHLPVPGWRATVAPGTF